MANWTPYYAMDLAKQGIGVVLWNCYLQVSYT